MKEDPNAMLICNLEVLLMPNGEIICEGKSIGWFDKLGKHLTATRHADGTPVKDGEFK